MAPPKSTQANLENKRTLYILIGYVTAMSILYISLEWRSGGIFQDGFFDREEYEFREDFIPVTWEVPEEELVPPVMDVLPPEAEEIIPDATDINIVENDTDITPEEGIGETENVPELPAPAEEIQPPAGLDRMPEFPGGLSALRAYIYKNLIYPTDALKAGIEGTVLCSFIITAQGRVMDIHILEGKTPEMDEEAQRILMQMPAWRPGIREGKPVAVRYVLPIVFRLR